MQVSRTTNYRQPGTPNRWRILCDDEELRVLASALHSEQLGIEAYVLPAPPPQGITAAEWRNTAKVRLAYVRAMRATIEGTTKGAST